MTDAWFAVNTKPHREFLAADHLRRQGFEVFLPASRRQIRHARKVSTKPTAYFPGYLFVAQNSAQWRSIMGTRGVRQLVMAGDQPALAPNALVELLRSHCNPDGYLEYQGPLHVGDQVRIEAGPFADFIGKIETLGPNDRVSVLLDLMATQTAVEFPRSQIMPTGVA